MYYFITFLFVLLAGKATFFDNVNLCWFIITAIILWVGLEKKRILKSDVKIFGTFSMIYVAFCTFRVLCLTNLSMHFWLSDITFLFKFILPSFLFCAVLKEKAIYYITKVMIDLAILSLPLYCLQLISGDLVYDLGKAINLPYAHFDGYVNMLVFTYVKIHTIRNSGFAWEPGAFGFFLILALMLHWLSNNFQFDKRAKWVTVAIVTTLSTTTYIAFGIMLLMYYRAKGVKLTTLLIFIGPILAFAVVSLPFLWDKIAATYQADLLDIKNIKTLSEYYIKVGYPMPLNRFGSMIFLVNTFGSNLIFGVSNAFTDTMPLLKHVSISNGIFSFCAQFGALGLGFLLYSGFKLFRQYVNIELSWYCVIIILVLGFGECIYVSTLLLAFLFLYKYARPQATIEESSNTTNTNSIGYIGIKRPVYN